MKQEKKVLKINIGDEYKVKVQHYSEFNESIFSEQYNKAKSIVKTIVLSGRNESNNTNCDERKSSNINDNFDYYNNIIVFTGERGTGKTSCMISFGKALLEPNYKYRGDCILEEVCFKDLRVIDPSLFENNNNILEVIIANMFEEFKEKVVDCEKKDQEKKRKLIEAFNEVCDNIKTMNMSKKDLLSEECIDLLVKMGAGSNLKRNMKNLVDRYLEFFGEEKNEWKLLLMIDDIDLNTKHAFEMVEQIRKYLILPNVVILMAVKLRQLFGIIEQNYFKEFEILMIKNHISENKPNIMTEKYLEKLIPQERRIYLNSLVELMDNVIINLVEETKNNTNYSYENIIRELIFNKTDLLFLNPKTHLSFIIPRNLREYISLVIMINKLDKDKKDENRRIFKKYFLENWIKNNLEKKYSDSILELSNKDIDKKNNFIVRKIEEILSIRNEIKIKNENLKTKKGYILMMELNYLEITEKINSSFNISIGDVLTVLKLFELYRIDIQDEKFIFAIKTYYSMIFFEKYFLIESKKNNTNAIFENIEYNELQILISNSLFNENQYGLMLPEKENKGIKRDKRLINYSIIKEVLINLIEGKIELKRNVNKKIEILSLIEWFHFFIIDKKVLTNVFFRTSSKPAYNLKQNFTSNRVSVVNKVAFDILFFTFNELSVSSLHKKFTYLDDIDNEKKSVLEKLSDLVISYKGISLTKILKENRKCNFEYFFNLEVLESVLAYDYEINEGNNLLHMLNFFKEIKKILTINTGFTGKNYNIEIVSRIVNYSIDLLSSCDQKLFDEIFVVDNSKRNILKLFNSNTKFFEIEKIIEQIQDTNMVTNIKGKNIRKNYLKLIIGIIEKRDLDNLEVIKYEIENKFSIFELEKSYNKRFREDFKNEIIEYFQKLLKEEEKNG